MATSKFSFIQLTESDRKDIIRMRKQGDTVKNIAEYIGCTVSTIYRHLKVSGMTARKVWSEREDAEAVQMYNTGAGSSEIAKHLGRDKKNVWRRLMYLRKLGKEVRYRKK